MLRLQSRVKCMQVEMWIFIYDATDSGLLWQFVQVNQTQNKEPHFFFPNWILYQNKFDSIKSIKGNIFFIIRERSMNIIFHILNIRKPNHIHKIEVKDFWSTYRNMFALFVHPMHELSSYAPNSFKPECKCRLYTWRWPLVFSTFCQRC